MSATVHKIYDIILIIVSRALSFESSASIPERVILFSLLFFISSTTGERRARTEGHNMATWNKHLALYFRVQDPRPPPPLLTPNSYESNPVAGPCIVYFTSPRPVSTTAALLPVAAASSLLSYAARTRAQNAPSESTRKAVRASSAAVRTAAACAASVRAACAKPGVWFLALSGLGMADVVRMRSE